MSGSVPASAGLIAFAVYIVLLLLAAAAGMILLILHAKYVDFAPEPLEIPRGKRLRTAFLNPGMLLLVVFCVVLIALTLFGGGLA